MSCQIFNDVTYLSLIWRNSHIMLSFHVIISLIQKTKQKSKTSKLK